MLDMLNREILPSVFKYQNKLAQTITNKKTIKVSSTNEISLLKEINELTNKVEASRKYLLDALKIVRNISD
jgi:glutamine synthetase type III